MPHDATNPTPWHAIVKIAEKREAQRLVFGWMYTCKTADGQVVGDHSGESIDIEVLEKAVYGFNLDARAAGEVHQKDASGRKRQVGRLVESVVFSPEKMAAMGIAPGVLPEGAWVGFRIDDDAAWEGVKAGRYKMLSLGGTALKEAIKP